jgi:dienelactone hydrolase
MTNRTLVSRLVMASGAAMLLTGLVSGAARAEEEQAPETSPLVCDAYAGDPDPTLQRADWQQRDLNNMACSTQRQQDATNPAFKAKYADATARYADDFPRQAGDPFRVPEEWAASGRGQMRKFTFLGNRGTRMFARLYSPNPEVPGPLPVIAFSPGLQSYNEINAWFGQDMAEAGYIVLIIDPQGQGRSESGCRNADGSSASCTGHNNLTSAIDFLLTTPATPHPHAGSPNAVGAMVFNPEWERVDPERLGIAGHSLGAINATPVAQSDPRVKAVVAYDNLDGTLGASVPRRTPALYFYADYAFPAFSYPMATPPNATGHWGIFNQLRASPHNVDVMTITTRASTHYEWGYQPEPFSFPASRYGERVAAYFSLAWFDRYLKNDPTALDRLTAHRFDDSIDRSSIGAGTFDPDAFLADPSTPGAGNVPLKIQGLCIADLLSFYYRSAFHLAGGSQVSLDMRRRGCPPPVEPALDVEIAVKPGERDGPAPVQPSGRGVVPVAMLATAEFDPVTRVHRPSLRFGKTGEEESLSYRGDGAPHCSAIDVDADGLTDLVCRFAANKLGYAGGEGAAPAVLTGRTNDTRPHAIRGEDVVQVL